MTLHGTREGRTIAALFANLDDRITLLRDAMAAEKLTLGALLAGWLEQERIAKGELAATVAASLLESGAMTEAARVLSETGIAPQALRDAATGVAAIQGMTDAQWAAEDYWHGHGERRPR